MRGITFHLFETKQDRFQILRNKSPWFAKFTEKEFSEKKMVELGQGQHSVRIGVETLGPRLHRQIQA